MDPAAAITQRLHSNIMCERAGVFPQVFGRVRFGKWISHLTAQSSPHWGNDGAAQERLQDGHNLITTNTHVHLYPVILETHTLYRPTLSEQNIEDILLILIP